MKHSEISDCFPETHFLINSVKMKNLFLINFIILLIMSCTPSPNPSSDANKLSSDSSAGTAVKMGGNTIYTVGKLPGIGSVAPDFTLTDDQMQDVSLNDFRGQNVILNIFPSIDTKTCAQSVRMFNERAAGLENTVVLCISKDLPFAQSRFCGAEGIENVITLSDFRTDFGHLYGVELAEGRTRGLLSRAVVVIDPEGRITYEEQVAELSEEPDYDAAIAAVES